MDVLNRQRDSRTPSPRRRERQGRRRVRSELPRNALRQAIRRAALWSVTALSMSALSLPTYALDAGALPTGASIVSGTVSTSVSGSRLDVLQQSSRAIIDWQTFDIGAAAHVDFRQPSSSAIVLNRVLGGNGSEIAGRLTANGQVFLVNPNGILFAPGARADVGGLVASTLDIGNDNFLAGNYELSGDGGRIVNAGELVAADGGYIGLFAPQVENSGLVTAKFGTVAIGSGTRVTLDFAGDSLLNFVVDDGADGARITHTGTLAAGRVLLTAREASELARSVVNQEGYVDASSLVNDGGVIRLVADTVFVSGGLSANGVNGGSIAVEASSILHSDAITATGSNGNGGNVTLAADRILQPASATIDVSGSNTGGRIVVDGATSVLTSAGLRADGGVQGGSVDLLGDTLQLAAATLSATGGSGGGTIHVGGDFQGVGERRRATTTQVNAFTTLDASATGDGDGGTVVVWSDAKTTFAGTVRARGGEQGGDGGLIEVSGHDTLAWAGKVDASAPRGQAGTLLLDPKNIFIDAAGQLPLLLVDLADPNMAAGDRHGAGATVELVNGNLVQVSADDDFAATDAGAVYLYSQLDGSLLATLTGSSAGDHVGSGGVTALVNGNYVVSSTQWDNGAAIDAGAATWGDGVTGVSGAISAANSLVGGSSNDRIGSGGITALASGHYVVNSLDWDNGAAVDAGAVTWGDGVASYPTVGLVSATNSLVGSSSNDRVGSGGVVAVGNGDYLVLSQQWDNGAAADAGAVSWGHRGWGAVGAVSAANSLVGSSANDQVGSGGITVLSNGHYVVSSSSWDNGALADAGAVTWGHGGVGVFGTVSSSNSLVGSSAGDQVGSNGVVSLGNGHYVVSSSSWNNGATLDVGAVTWRNGTGAVSNSGFISAANSLVGSTSGDAVGIGGVTALAGGHYAVNSYLWNNGAALAAGAVTRGNGTGGTVGAVTAANSLVGSSSNDRVGSGGVVALANGHYVVSSSQWDNGAAVDAGAVTWANANGSTVGAVSAVNSLVGGSTNDRIGDGGIVQLANGNYVVGSTHWDNGVAVDAGAATWRSGYGGGNGLVSAANSLVGSSTNDLLGSGGITALANGNYVVTSTLWNNGAAIDAGAVTWGNGNTGSSGAVSAANSLVGSSNNDVVGNGGITTLANGNYVVSSTLWDNGTALDAGAAAWGNGATGSSGVIGAANSLVGGSSNDNIGSGGITALLNGNYVVNSWRWDNGTAIDAGAVSWGNGSIGSTGLVSASNSLVGSRSGDQVGIGGVSAFSTGNYAVNSYLWDNGLLADAGAVTWADGALGAQGLVTINNSLFGRSAGDRVGSGGITALANGDFVVRAPDHDNGGLVDSGRVVLVKGGTKLVTLDLADPFPAAGDLHGYGWSTQLPNGNIVQVDISDDFAAVNSGAMYLYNPQDGSLVSVLTGSTSNDFQRYLNINNIHVLANGNFILLTEYWDNGGVANAGAVTWVDADVGISGMISASTSLVGSSTDDRIGLSGVGMAGAVHEVGDSNFVVIASAWDNGAVANAGALTWIDGDTGLTGVVSAANSLVGTRANDAVGSLWNSVAGTNSFVIASPLWDNGAVADAGAVTWVDANAGLTGAVSAANSLVGSTAGDKVGENGILLLAGGNYLVSSRSWTNAGAAGAGALTWMDGDTGLTGAVSAANSLVGTTANDRVGYAAVLGNGNAVALTAGWDNGAVANVGAVTWIDGSTGLTGAVSAANSRIGSTASDAFGSGYIRELANGHFVVLSPEWDNGAVQDAGAVTWMNGFAASTGTASAADSLVGSTAFDRVGDIFIALANGDYVIASPRWDNGAVVDAGAVTLIDGSTGLAGTVSAANSLVGSTAGDQVGLDGVVEVGGGNFVVLSHLWDNGAVVDAGAVTWVDGSSGLTGTLSAANSLVGSTAGDQLSADTSAAYPDPNFNTSAVTVLANGNYVIASPKWDNGALVDAGAMTWANGLTGITGTISAANSLVGSAANDLVGGRRAYALANGNYFVTTSSWDNGAISNAGAVTWADGLTGISGTISAANSLVGSSAGDSVGGSGATVVLTPLANGHYVLTSSFWDNGTVTNAGAVTWLSATAATTGTISAANSLVGSTANDQVGGSGITALANGNYIVRSSNWDNGLAVDAGAVTWGSGTAGVRGVVSAANSLVGSTSNDRVGNGGVYELDDGHYAVVSSEWDRGAVADAGAVTWGNGTIGVRGTVSAVNSVVGNSPVDRVGYHGGPLGVSVNPLAGGDFVVRASLYDLGGLANTGWMALVKPTPVFGSLDQFLFGDDPALDLTLTPDQVTAILDTGTALVLQANNDITVNSAIVTDNASGNGGALTLQAGRSVLVNADIVTDNGNLTLVANELVANGAIPAYRDAGTATLAIADGVLIDAGTGDISMTVAAEAKAGNETLVVGSNATVTGNRLQLLNHATDGDMTINAGAVLAATATGDALQAGATNGGAFTNLGGDGALSAANGRWLVYSFDPATTTEGIASYNKRYNFRYGDDTSVLTAAGNYFLYGIAPQITAVADPGQGKFYGDPEPALTWSAGGAIDGDGIGFAGAIARAAGEDVGNYAIGQGTLALDAATLALGYQLVFNGDTFVIAPRGVTVTATANAGQGKTYGAADPLLGWTLTSGSLAPGDSFSGALARAPGENVGNYAINQGTLALGSNYTLNFIGDIFTITPATLTIRANHADGYTGFPLPPLGYTASGFMFADTAALLSGVTVTTTATAASGPGDYAIVASGGNAGSNYTLVWVDGVLEIHPRVDSLDQYAEWENDGRRRQRLRSGSGRLIEVSDNLRSTDPLARWAF